MRVLVTGASGMLGRETARAFAARGDRVRLLQRRPAGLAGFEEVLGSVTDPDACARAVAGIDAVVHLAAKVSVTGPHPEYVATNVDGTANLLEAARAAGVQRFVMVSSPSVAHAGSALVGVGTTAADPDAAHGSYAQTKARAELLALGADAPGFAVCAVRPHIVLGPGDTQLVQRIADRARAGRLPLLDDGTALIDTTYVDNAVDALVAALDRCIDEGVHGEAFVVTNGEPRTVAEVFARICAAAGVAAPTRRVPSAAAKVAGGLVERVWTRFALPDEPPMTRFLAEQLSTAHWFDVSRTRQRLGWSPRVPLDEGFSRLAGGFAAR
ncbi:NAD-dependent epimerase/dehydratase family protein [Kineococcus rhizosphaerae]|uniref:Nucleoside-diphosphate-sugar epimerase n=1 Tax=Kineococcus rhizosphaerae TaxID=559628 RepID=A0A2T0RAJ8_9ACTN|nr:NAD-dependent epimerase/dehydratase family protein [Kineococcus rhizosphaerae]PRY18187.1 nucleoside-diphosphate-sugar epimerase [Kineococcus rhizosphaerae]